MKKWHKNLIGGVLAASVGAGMSLAVVNEIATHGDSLSCGIDPDGNIIVEQKGSPQLNSYVKIDETTARAWIVGDDTCTDPQGRQMPIRDLNRAWQNQERQNNIIREALGKPVRMTLSPDIMQLRQ
jgi:hypothetical protein